MVAVAEEIVPARAADVHVRWCLRGARLAAGLVLVLGLTPVVAWVTGYDLPTRFHAQWPSLPPVVALGVVMLAAAVGRHAEQRRRARLPAVGATLLGAGALVDWVVDGPHGVSLAETAGLAGVGVAMLLPETSMRWVRLRQGLVLLIGFGSLVALNGYLLGVNQLHPVPFFRSMSLPGALAFALVATGYFLAQPQIGFMRLVTAPTAGGRLLRRMVVPIVLLPLLINGLERATERYGVIPAGFGWLLDGAISVYLLGIVVLLTARSLHRADEARRTALEQMAQSEERYRRLIEMSPDAIVVKSRGAIEYVNPAAVRLLGATSAGELVGRSPLDYLHPASRAALDPKLCSLLVHGQSIQPTEQRIIRRDGAALDIEVAAAPVDFHGRRVAQMVLRDLTERNRATAEARQLREQLDLLVTTAPIVLYTARLGACAAHTYVSPSVAAILGYTPDEFVDQPEFWINHVHPEDRPRVTLEVLGASSSMATSVHVYRFEVKAGGYRWIRDERRVVPEARAGEPAVVGYWHDITESRRAASALRKIEELYRTTFDSAAVGVMHARLENRRIVRVNATFTALLGYQPAELRQRTADEITHPDDRAEDARQMGRLLADEIKSYRREKRYVRSSGGSVWVEVTVSLARNTQGRPTHVIAVCIDISQRRELEAQLRQSQKMEAVGQLAGGIAHDFNNILTAVQANAQLIAMDPTLPEAVQTSTHDIDRAVRRGAGLTRQLLMFSRRQVMQVELVQVGEALTNLAGMLHRLLGEQIRLTVVPTPAAVAVNADRGMLDQVIINLAVNARDAMLPAGGELRVTVTTETFAATQTRGNPPGAYVCIAVADTGCGIPADILPHIFEPFFTTKSAGRGTGLGLATVFGIINQHHGWITVETESGRGSVFRVYLPAAAATAPAAPAVAAQTSPVRGGGATILVVEDEEAVRTITVTLLRRHGFNVLAAVDGASALAMWNTHRAAIDLLITDVVMPGGITGPELANRLQLERPELPVLLMSGYNPEQAGRLLSLPERQAFLAKPFEVPALLARIDLLLRSDRPGAGGRLDDWLRNAAVRGDGSG
ncbi:PAS domain S-box protein [Opitutus sp. ER46]|uniref:PAS domain S-box protein n=1 Tax=Opitutus sp. ER46 TaxID=2161864 RepID=UPI000D2FFCE8|nr:PAS domain S-box protein [Opitutus sp. ER46]PTX97962.1 hypothetical protein DB354_06750 [Opitutus sp. ER46]